MNEHKRAGLDDWTQGRTVPAEVAQISQELAEAVWNEMRFSRHQEAAALIEAWVREREARILEEVALSFERLYWKLDGAVDAAKCVRAFATARKQQETS